jgi:hypothetical protein
MVSTYQRRSVAYFGQNGDFQLFLEWLHPQERDGQQARQFIVGITHKQEIQRSATTHIRVLQGNEDWPGVSRFCTSFQLRQLGRQQTKVSNVRFTNRKATGAISELGRS